MVKIGDRVETNYGVVEVVEVYDDIVNLAVLKEGAGPSPAKVIDYKATFSLNRKQYASIRTAPELLKLHEN